MEYSNQVFEDAMVTEMHNDNHCDRIMSDPNVYKDYESKMKITLQLQQTASPGKTKALPQAATSAPSTRRGRKLPKLRQRAKPGTVNSRRHSRTQSS